MTTQEDSSLNFREGRPITVANMRVSGAFGGLDSTPLSLHRVL